MASRHIITHLQMKTLAEALMEYLGLSTGKLKTSEARHKAKASWVAIAARVNAVGEAQKTGPEWKKYWTDKKCVLKKKAQARRASAKQNGGDVNDLPRPTDLEEKLLILCGEDSVCVNDCTNIPLFDTPTLEEEENDGEQAQPDRNIEDDLEHERLVCRNIDEERLHVEKERLAADLRRETLEQHRLNVEQERLALERERLSAELRREALEEQRLAVELRREAREEQIARQK